MSKVIINTVELAKEADSTGVYGKRDVDKSENSGATFQATLGTAGTTTATVVIEVSNDNVGWIPAGTITLSGANDSDGFASNASWKYVRANVTALGAGADITVTMGG